MGVDLYAITNKELNKVQWKNDKRSQLNHFMGEGNRNVLSYPNKDGCYEEINYALEDLGFPAIPCRFINDGFYNPLHDVSDKALDRKLDNGDMVDFYEFCNKIENSSCKAYYTNKEFIEKHKPNYKREECFPFSGCKGVDISEILYYNRSREEKDECTRLYKLWTPELFEKLADIDHILCLHAIELYNLYVDGYFFYWSV